MDVDAFALEILTIKLQRTPEDISFSKRLLRN
jgi:hypothetical protein